MANNAMADPAKITGGSDDPFWDAALQQFKSTRRPAPPKDSFLGDLKRKHQLKKIEFFDDFVTKQSSISEAKNVCMEIKAEANDEYTNSSVNLILGNLNYVISAGDLAFKGGAETVALAWSGIKFILLAVQQDRANCGVWAAAGAAISTVLVACRTLGRLYRMPAGSPPVESAQEVTQKLTPLYLSILGFSWAAKVQLDHSKGRRVFDQYNPLSSAGDASPDALNAIKSSAKEIREASTVAFQEWSKQAAEKSTVLQQSVKDDIKAFQSQFMEYTQDIQKISSTLETMNQNIYALFASSQKQEGMMEKIVQSIGPKTPYELDKQRFLLNKKLLNPQEEYLSSSFEAKVNVHKQRPSTCQWIFEDSTTAFKEWRNAPLSESKEKGLLWLSGGAGYGKSILTTHVLERLKEKETDIACYFYCSRIDSSDGPRTTARIKQDLVYQLYAITEQDPDMLSDANKIFAKPANKKKGQEKVVPSMRKVGGTPSATAANQLPDLDEALPALVKILNSKVFIVIDAMDECDDRVREEFVDTLKMWASNEKSQIRVFVSSRREDDLVTGFQDLPNLKVEDYNAADIRDHTTGELSSIPGLSSQERSLICQAVVDRANGQFTYVNLALNILRKPFIRPIENLINKLAANNRGMNQETLKRVDPAYSQLARTCLELTLLRQDDITVGEVMDFFSGTYNSREANKLGDFWADGGAQQIQKSETLSEAATAVEDLKAAPDDDHGSGKDDLNGDLTKEEAETNITANADSSDTGAAAQETDVDEVAAAESNQSPNHENDSERFEMYKEQLRAAAGPFLDITGIEAFVVENHPSVRESFLAEDGAEEAAHTKGGVCATCERPHDDNQDFLVGPKFGHIKAAIQCLRHLNNPDFQKLFLVDPSTRKTNEAADEGDAEAGEENSEETTAPAEDDKSENEDATTSTEEAVDGKTEGETPNGIEKKFTNEAGADGAPDSTTAPGDHVNGDVPVSADSVETPDTSIVALNGDVSKKDHDDSDASASQPVDGTEPTANGETPENKDTTKEAGNAESAEEEEITKYTYQDSEADEDDMDKDAETETQKADNSDPLPRKRYEIFGWVDHMRRVEEEWGWSTRTIDPFNLGAIEKEWESSDENVKAIWVELKDELMHFFYGENGGFRPWFLKIYERQGGITAAGYFGPLHMTSFYGLASVAVMLCCEHGESIIEKDEVTGSVPLYFLRYSVAFNEEINVIKFFSGQTTNQAAADEACRKYLGESWTEGMTLGRALMASIPTDRDYDSTTHFECFFVNGNPDGDMVRALIEINGKCDQWDPIDRRDIMHDVASYSTWPEIVAILTEEADFDINSRYPEEYYNNTPLHLLMSRTDLPDDLLEAFLKVPGIDVNAEDTDSERPLIGSCRRGHPGAAKRLLEAKADVHDLDTMERCAVHLACYNGQLEILNVLIEYDAYEDLLKVGKDGRSPLYLACWQRKKDVCLRMLELLKDEPINKVDQPSSKGHTPMRKACWAGMTEVVEALLAFPGSDECLSKVSKLDGQNPFHVAAAKGHSRIVKLLLDRNADTRAEDSNKRTPLQLAFEGWGLSFGGDYEETIMLLLEKDPSLASCKIDPSDDLVTAAHVAAAKGGTRVLNRLMRHGMPHSQKDRHGWTPLLLAKQAHHNECADLLESFGASTGNRPSGFSPIEDDDIEMSVDGTTMTCKPGGTLSTSVLSNHPIPADVLDTFYYEVTLEDFEEENTSSLVAMGLCSDTHATHIYGWWPGHFRKGVRSWGYHCDDGVVYDSTKTSARNRAVEAITHETWREVGRTVGCGLNMNNGTLFFTLDGEKLETPCEDVGGRLYPIVGLGSGTKATLNFGDKKDFVYKPANELRKRPQDS